MTLAPGDAETPRHPDRSGVKMRGVGGEVPSLVPRSRGVEDRRARALPSAIASLARRRTRRGESLAPARWEAAIAAAPRSAAAEYPARPNYASRLFLQSPADWGEVCGAGASSCSSAWRTTCSRRRFAGTHIAMGLPGLVCQAALQAMIEPPLIAFSELASTNTWGPPASLFDSHSFGVSGQLWGPSRHWEL